MALIYHVILQDYVIKGSFDFMDRSPSRQVTILQCLVSHHLSHPASHHPTKFGGHRHCDGGDIIILVCHVISQDHVMKPSCDFMSKSPSR